MALHSDRFDSCYVETRIPDQQSSIACCIASGMTVSCLPLSRPYAGAAAILGDELHTGVLKGAFYCGDIVSARISSAFFESNDDVSGNGCGFRKASLIQIDNTVNGLPVQK